MPDRLSQVAEVLVKHPSIDRGRPGVVYDWCCPACGISLDGGPNSPACAAHQAEALAAAGLLPTEPEWGVEHRDDLDMADPWVNPAVDEQTARESACQHGQNLRVMRREVTAWVAADEGSVTRG